MTQRMILNRISDWWKNSICKTKIVSHLPAESDPIFCEYERFCLLAFRFLHKFIFLLACNRRNQIKANELNATQFLFEKKESPISWARCVRGRWKGEEEIGVRDFSFHYFISFY